MNKSIIVIDQFKNIYQSTYLKRAKGLVKKGRAKWIDENTICLLVPLEKSEEKMDKKELKALAALIAAIIWNTNNYSIEYADSCISAGLYNETLQKLLNLGVDIPDLLGKINYEKYEQDPYELTAITFRKAKYLEAIITSLAKD